jgi:hypothetical protein
VKLPDNLFAELDGAGYNRISSLGVVPTNEAMGAASEKKPFEPDQDNWQKPACLRRKVI